MLSRRFIAGDAAAGAERPFCFAAAFAVEAYAMPRKRALARVRARTRDACAPLFTPDATLIFTADYYAFAAFHLLLMMPERYKTRGAARAARKAPIFIAAAGC
jgi:hypothetical protein